MLDHDLPTACEAEMTQDARPAPEQIITEDDIMSAISLIQSERVLGLKESEIATLGQLAIRGLRALPSETQQTVHYERRPNLDRRISLGDDYAGDAWVRWTAVGHTPENAAPHGHGSPIAAEANSSSVSPAAAAPDQVRDQIAEDGFERMVTTPKGTETLTPFGEAVSILEAIDATGLLFRHNITLDANVANFLHRQSEREQSQ